MGQSKEFADWMEAAERAGVSVSALKVRAHRAYNAIKAAFLTNE